MGENSIYTVSKNCLEEEMIHFEKDYLTIY